MSHTALIGTKQTLRLVGIAQTSIKLNCMGEQYSVIIELTITNVESSLTSDKLKSDFAALKRDPARLRSPTRAAIQTSIEHKHTSNFSFVGMLFLHITITRLQRSIASRLSSGVNFLYVRNLATNLFASTASLQHGK